MKRNDIINHIGPNYLTTNIENDEFSYQKALKSIGKNIIDYQDSTWKRKYKDIDLRFANERLTILIETKDNFDKYSIDDVFEQLNAYIKYEKELTTNKIIAIVANTIDDRILVFYGDNVYASQKDVKLLERKLKKFNEYEDVYFGVANNKIKVIQSTYNLNELLHQHGINERIRSQFVGTCLLALKNGLTYKGCRNSQIRSGIQDVLTNLLEKDLNKATKISILKTKVLDSQDVKSLKDVVFITILNTIEKDILPYINEKSTQGQDILNLFFTTFNKYVGKTDKNQAFTPDHIVHFMCKVCNVNRNSYVLDPCCGSGAFLVRALTEAMDDCDSDEERAKIKKEHIYGIEYEERAFGLSTTNMLIHGDGNSNILNGSCFTDLKELIKDVPINVVLMNPPYNAQRNFCLESYVKTWGDKIKEDPSKGFHYVYYVASMVKTGKLAVLLPMSCAIGTSSEIKKYKQLMLNEHTLDAVFSMPIDMFHPGAAAIAVCMVFNLGTRHENAPIKETFFGYFRDDGFRKKKNLGRIEKTDINGKALWEGIEKEWLHLYRNRITKTGLSVTKKVTAKDEWLAEAYMNTDYSTLNINDFQNVLDGYLGYLVGKGMKTDD